MKTKIMIIEERKKLKPQMCIGADTLIQIICNSFKIEKELLISKTNKTPIPRIRQIFFFFMYQNSNMTLREIASCMDRKDHGTVLHGVSKIEGLIFINSDITKQVAEIKSRINNHIWANVNQKSQKNTPEDRKSFIYSPIQKAS